LKHNKGEKKVIKKELIKYVGLFLIACGGSFSHIQAMPQDKLSSIKNLPFCAMIFFEDLSNSRQDVRVIMDQDDISENNLKLLFSEISRKYSASIPLDVLVYTDLIEPGALANGENISGGNEPSSLGKDNKRSKVADRKNRISNGVPRGAFYMRRENVELFRYNPSYPDYGMKTITLKGKE
jgi:hypothetical protein